MRRHLSRSQRWFLLAGCISAFILFDVGRLIIRKRAHAPDEPAFVEPHADTRARVARIAPEHFPPNTYLPKMRESQASGAIDLASFSPGRVLVHVDDPRVWWESDHDRGDTEDDHTVHVSIEAPLRRLIELVSQEGGTLKVQDTYRPNGIHNPRSLHKEGRAIDLTCDELGLDRLAKLCWLAGFDWVYYEAKSRGGSHVHCSVRRQASIGE